MTGRERVITFEEISDMPDNFWEDVAREAAKTEEEDARPDSMFYGTRHAIHWTRRFIGED
jgi:23S rRNA G2445 N2-methylase RlmL